MIPICTLLRSLAQESRMKIIQTRAQAYMKANPTETRLGVTNGRYSFRKNITSQSDFQLNKAMNMRCRSPEQHRRKGTTNSHTGNSTSTSLCTTSSPSLSSVCRRGGEGEGALWFPVLWFHVLPLPPRWPLAWGAVTRMTYDCLLEREAWLGGGGGAYHGHGGGGGGRDAAPYMHLASGFF